MIQCLRSIALELITFLAQLEDFQKKLWLKKEIRVVQSLLHHAWIGAGSAVAGSGSERRQWAQWGNSWAFGMAMRRGRWRI